jgi:DNA (cytosine-5)-methyltransferase 1
MKGAYYNENDPFAAEWLRALIGEGHIAPGDVDERSIEDICPSDLEGYAQHHFFAGIGVWSYALRRAGWPDDRPVWTGSCPCQPFSSAGKGGGFADERHLWPAWSWLIGQHRPGVILGEQVASKDGRAWFDLVSSDMEALDYACGAVDTCAAGVGAPHIRQRLYWVANNSDRPGARRGDDGEVLGVQEAQRQSELSTALPGRSGADGDVVDAESQQTGLPGCSRQSGGSCVVANDDERRDRSEALSGEGRKRQPSDCSLLGNNNKGLEVGQVATVEPGSLRIEGSTLGPSSLVCGRWAGADWIFCRDGKYRPVEPGTFPLAHGAAARVGRLRGYGNAINAEQAKVFIEAVRDLIG